MVWTLDSYTLLSVLHVYPQLKELGTYRRDPKWITRVSHVSLPALMCKTALKTSAD